MTRWTCLVYVLVVCALLAVVVTGEGDGKGEREKKDPQAFDHDVHFLEEETGERFRLKSKGKLSEIVDLDTIPSVKRILCKNNKILVALKQDAPDVSWVRGQIIIGSHGWGCGHNTAKPGASTIYAKIAEVKRPKKYVVEVHTETAGPLDMFEHADITVHYEQGSKGAHERQKRDKSNFLRKSLNKIDWTASFSENLAFNRGHNDTAEREINVFKDTGPYYPQADTESNKTYDDKDFLFTCHDCHGYSHLSYYFELKIFKIKNEGVVQNHRMQIELDNTIKQNYSLFTDKETTLTKYGTLWQTPTANIFDVALITFSDPDLPPIRMAVNFSDQANVYLTSSTRDQARYDGDFTLNGHTVISQSYDKAHEDATVNDITSYNWTVTSDNQYVDTNATMNATFAVHQNITISPLVYWDLRDVDMLMGPSIKLSIRPTVNVVSTTDTVSRCDTSSIYVNSSVFVPQTNFKIDAFGIDIWNLTIMGGVSKKEDLLQDTLMEHCHADCHGPVEIGGTENDTMDTICYSSYGSISRGSSQFYKLHQLYGDYILFDSNVTQPSWCSTDGQACPDCTAHAYNPDFDNACAERIVNYALASSLTRLAKLIEAEWPDRKLVVLQAWNEPTADFPAGVNGAWSAYAEARAADVAITEPLADPSNPFSYTIESSPYIIERLGELAGCSRFPYVRLVNSSASMCVQKVFTPLVKKRSLLSRKRRSGHLHHEDVYDILVKIDAALAPKKNDEPDPTPLALGEDFPSGFSMERICGEPTGRVTQDDVISMKRLVEFPTNAVTFEPEGPLMFPAWCGVESRHCRDCSSPTSDLDDTWSWCMTRIMTMRAAIRLQRLATLVDGEVDVKTSLSQSQPDGTSDLFKEGRALCLAPSSSSNLTMETFTSKVKLAGFDYVSYSSSDCIEVCVKPQDGIQTQVVQFPLVNLIDVAQPIGHGDEYAYPAELQSESRRTLLYDRTTSPDEFSYNFRLSDFQSPGDRFLRVDPIMLDLLELAYDQIDGGFFVIPKSGYRPRSVNLDNSDTRHHKERDRYQSGQAVEIKPNAAATEDKLYKMGVALIRAGKSVRTQRIGIGLGCKEDRLYFEVRPMSGNSSQAIEAWSSGSDSLYERLNRLANLVQHGGTVVTSTADSVNCATPKLGEDHYYFNFDLDEEGYCEADLDATFCSDTLEHRQNISIVFQRRLTSNAGSDRLPREIIMPEIESCVVDKCGGCPTQGSVWNEKVMACTSMILLYLSRASVPFQPLEDKVAIFNTDNHNSAAHAQACEKPKICVENTNIYSHLIPLLTAKYFKDNVPTRLFEPADNASPLLEIVEQELAWRATGHVEIYLETHNDVNALRNVIKVVMMYNDNVTDVKFWVDPDAEMDKVTTEIIRKIEEWTRSVCPTWSRKVSTPYTVGTYSHSRKKRSLEQSRDRNKRAFDMKNWEIDWMLKS